MYKVITYKDRAGNDDIAAFIQELMARLKPTKTREYATRKLWSISGSFKFME